MVTAFLQNPNDVRHMGRKRGQILLNALFIADIREDMVEHADLTSVIHWNMKSAFRHQAEKSDGLKCDCLAAGIGAGDHQSVEILSQRYIDGHRRILRQKWMTGMIQDDIRFRNLRLHAVEIIGELCLREDQIQSCQDLEIRTDLFTVCSTFRRQLHKDPLDLQFLPGCQFPKLVVGFHRSHRFDKQSRTAGRNIMYQAGHRIFVFRLYRYDVAVGSHRDDGLLQRFCITGGGNDLIQCLSCPTRSRTHLPSDICKFGGCTVRDLIFPYNGGSDFFFQRTVRPEC